MEPSNWRKSSYSGSTTGNCVEVAAATGQVAVRDTTDRGGLTLAVPAGAWTALLAALR